LAGRLILLGLPLLFLLASPRLLLILRSLAGRLILLALDPPRHVLATVALVLAGVSSSLLAALGLRRWS